MTRARLLASVAGAAMVAAGPAFADSLTPASFSASIAVGASTSINDKLGTIAAGPPTTAQADVLFVVDTTGSMSAGIALVRSTLSTVVSDLSSLGNIATGAAQYKDAANSPSDGFNYQLNQDITTNTSLTQTALNGFTASGGGDTPEQGLYALGQGATTTTWRAGSKRIEVITGDAPSHSSPSHPVAASGVGVGSTASTLIGSGVTMIALDANPVTHGDGGLDAYGQFSALLADGVAGPPVAGFTNATTLVDDIVSAIGSSFETYSVVSLALIGPAPTDCSVSLPTSISGSFDRSVTRTFGFGAVGITGLHAGVCSFTIGLEADGVLLATETDTINVGAIPEPASLAVLGAGLIGLGAARRFRRV